VGLFLVTLLIQKPEHAHEAVLIIHSMAFTHRNVVGPNMGSSSLSAVLPPPTDSVGYTASALDRLVGRTLLVPHISKNGGTAVNTMLLSVRPALNLSGMGTNKPLDLRSSVIVLHLPDNVVRVMSSIRSPVGLLAVIREPVDRVVSEFLFMRARYSSRYVNLPKVLSSKNVTWRQWTEHPKQQNFQLAYLRGFAMFSHVTSQRDWQAWLSCMSRVPVVLLAMGAINSVLPAIVEHTFPGSVVEAREPVGRWGRGFGVSAANASLWRRAAPELAKGVALPNVTERERIRQLNSLDGQLFQLAQAHTEVYTRHLASEGNPRLRERDRADTRAAGSRSRVREP
jgi:hypothetical protein